MRQRKCSYLLSGHASCVDRRDIGIGGSGTTGLRDEGNLEGRLCLSPFRGHVDFGCRRVLLPLDDGWLSLLDGLEGLRIDWNAAAKGLNALGCYGSVRLTASQQT